MVKALDPEFEERLFAAAAKQVIKAEVERPIDASAGADRAAASSLRRGLEQRRQSFEEVLDRPFDKAFEMFHEGEYTVFHVGRQHVVVGRDLIIDHRAKLAGEQHTASVTEFRTMIFKEDEIDKVLVQGERRGAGLKSLDTSVAPESVSESRRGKGLRSGTSRSTPTKRRKRERSKAPSESDVEGIALDRVGAGFVDAILSAMASRRGGKMSDIVATIQSDQDAMMRFTTSVALAIDGGPGTGKTVVGLHRLAFVAYEDREAGAGKPLLMVGPSDQFVNYVKNVLVRLGERQIIQTSFGALCASVLRKEEKKLLKISLQDSELAALAKSTSVVFRVLRRMLLGRIRCSYVEMKTRESTWIEPRQIEEFLSLAYGNFMDGKTSMRSLREDLANWLFAYCGDDRNFAEVEERKRRSKAAKEDFERRKAAGEGVEVVSLNLKTRISIRDEATTLAERLVPEDDVLTLLARFHDAKVDVFPSVDSLMAPTEHELFLREVITRAETTSMISARRSGALSESDLPLVHELEVAIRGIRVQPYGHVMVDEAQDLTPAMAAVIRRHITKDQVTLLGDFNQRTRIDAMKTWDQVKSSLGLAQLERASLARSYRVPKPALDLASRVLSTDQRRLAPEGVRLGEPPEFHRTTAKLLLNVVAKVIKKSDEGQILVVASQEFVNSFETGDDRVVCVNAQKANGLEASLVIVVEPSSWTTESAESRQLLYVALTRTMTRLVIVYSEELPFGLSKPTKGKRRQKQPTKSTSRLRSFWSRA